MSQFNDEKNCGVPDPTQKTLSNFIVSGDPCMKNKDESMALDSEFSYDTFYVDRGTDLPTDIHDTSSELRDSGGENQVSDFNHGDCLLVQNDVDTEGSPNLWNNDFGEKVC